MKRSLINQPGIRGVFWPFIALLSRAVVAEGPGVPPQAQGGAQIPASASGTEMASGLSEEYLRLRDPFKRPMTASATTVAKTPLESFQVSEFKMVAVLTGPHQTRAIVVDPLGNSFFVGLNTKMGTHDGKVIQISGERIRVREKIANVLGQMESFDTDLLLAPESKMSKAVAGSRQQQVDTGKTK